MGFDLKPRKQAAGWFHMGAFSWSWMLDSGVGLVIGTGPGFSPASFVYAGRPDGRCPHYNDGCRVSAKEAKQMAQVAYWLADYHDTLYEVWMRESEEERERMLNDNHRLYKPPVRRDFVEKTRAFADWAKTSGGFRIY